MRYLTPGIEAPAPQTLPDAKPGAAERSAAWMEAWERLSEAQQAAWHALPRPKKDESYRWTAEELTANMTAVAPRKSRRVRAA